ncbi:MAG TPA: VanZ family protein [Thermoanaerobaculia bacterium]|jgi:glycopeptide antibiotics resistance protein
MQSTIVIRRPFTILLLLIATIAIAVTTLWMSGKSYSKIDPIPFEDLRHLVNRVAHRPVPTRVVALIVVPIIANVLLFMPWGFLMFIALYTVERPTVQTYVLTVLLGLTFACAIEAWQYFLPSRVADINDIIWNTVGTFLGAILAHLRLRLRFEFD